MGLLNLFDRFTRSFRKKKKRKTRRRKVGGQDKYSDLARDAMRRATGNEKIKAIKKSIQAKAEAAAREREKKRGSREDGRQVVRASPGQKLQRRRRIQRLPRIITAASEHKTPSQIVEEKSSSGRISPPLQYPGKGPGTGGGKRKTRRRKGRGYSKIHKDMFKKKYCLRMGGRWENGECKLSNAQAAQPGGGRRRKTRRRRRRRKRH